MPSNDSPTDAEPSGTEWHRQDFRRRVLSPLGVASDAVETERSEVEQELSAFRSFASTVEEVEPAVQNPPTGPPSLAIPDRECRAIGRIHDCYRETVMAVDHYDATYERTLEGSLHAEFGEPIARKLRCSNGPLTRTSKRAVLLAVAESINERERFLDQLDRERAWLDRARDALSDRLPGSAGTDTFDTTFDARLESMVAKRQRHIQQRSVPSHGAVHGLCRLLYGDREWTFPVLTALMRFRAGVENTDRLS